MNFRTSELVGLVMVVMLVFCCGCALMKDMNSDFVVGYDDLGIRTQSTSVGDGVSDFVSGIVSVNGKLRPFAEVIGYGVGCIASLLTGIFLGKKKRDASSV